MNAHVPPLLEPDRGQIETFAHEMFKHVPTEADAYISMRGFKGDEAEPYKKPEAVSIKGGLKHVNDAAMDWARRCANEKESITFCPPVAVLSSLTRAREVDLLYGPTLSVECDAEPEKSRATLEAILGKPTVVVKSGGEWTDETGHIQDKVHLHYRLKTPATGADLARLKHARIHAYAIVGADSSNNPIVHPIRWAGSWHTKNKAKPRLCTIAEITDNEIDLDTVIPLLEAAPKKTKTKANGEEKPWDGERSDWDELVGNIIAGKDLHESIAKLAAKMVRGGQNDGTIVNFLRGLMQHSAAKVARPIDWMAREGDIPRAVSTAREKYHEAARGDVVPVDLWASLSAPALPPGVLPKVIEKFALEQGSVMGADPAGLAVAALVVCAAAIPDKIKLQPRVHDQRWTESARLWGALVGEASKKKSPITTSAARPLVKIDIELANKYEREKAEYDALDADERKKERPPKRQRVRIGDSTPEAAEEILKASPDGVLSLHDELSGFFGALDKYTGGRGAAKDRAFYLQAYNGGAFVSDRISRGQTLIENLSISLLGGIQPSKMREIVNDTLDDGLIQRLIPVMLRPASVGRDVPQGPFTGDYEALVQRLHRLTKDGGVVLRFDTGAQKVWDRVEARHHALESMESFNKKLAAHIGKYNGIFCRLCLVFSCIESTHRFEPVSEDVAQRAEKLLHDFLFPHALVFYREMLGLSEDHDTLTDVAGYILARGLSELTSRDIARGSRSMRRLKKGDVGAVFEQLEALGWLTRSVGRYADAPRWLVNPSCHQLFAEKAAAEAKRRDEMREFINKTAGKRS